MFVLQKWFFDKFRALRLEFFIRLCYNERVNKSVVIF